MAPPLDVLGLPAGGGDVGRRAFLRGRRGLGTPTELPSTVARHVRRNCVNGTMAPLPVDVRTLRASQRGVASATLRAQTKAFWESEAGA
eukprot:114146-Pyramimonas_sp.AAC.1